MRLTRCTSTNALCVVTLLQETVDTTDGELKTRLGGARLRLRGGITRGLARLGLAAALARHVAKCVWVVVKKWLVVRDGVGSKWASVRTTELKGGKGAARRLYTSAGAGKTRQGPAT